MSRNFGEHVRDLVMGETPPKKERRRAEDEQDRKMEKDRARRENPPWRKMEVAEFIDAIRNVNTMNWELKPFDAIDVSFRPQKGKPYPMLTGEWSGGSGGLVNQKAAMVGLTYGIEKGKFEIVPENLSRDPADIREVDGIEYLYVGGTHRHGDGMRGMIPLEIIEGIQVVDKEEEK